MIETDSREMIGEYIFLSKYAKTVDNKKESWEDSVYRVMDMHKKFYKDKATDKEGFDRLMAYCLEAYLNKDVLGAQRALQFGGDSLLKKHTRLFNCSSTYVDRVDVFKELYYLLLSGCGCGCSVQKCHIDKLPIPKGFDNSSSTTVYILDSIEGWAMAIGVLFNNFFDGKPVPEFDYDMIRPEGAFISGGFKAPGPKPLEKAINKIKSLMAGYVNKRLTPYEVHYMICILADSVVSGGVRRSAMITMFDADDKEMAECKTGNWINERPELCRSNNSAVILPETHKAAFDKLFDYTCKYGEPGFIFVDSKDYVFNPCLTGDTLVKTRDGLIPIKDLSDNFYVESAYFDDFWHRNFQKAVAYKTGHKTVNKVILSNGASFRCTPDHRLALLDGTYREANQCLGSQLSCSHTVMSIEYDCEEDVYDLTVENNHNFYINADGTEVLVHNCGEVCMYPQIEEDGINHSGWGFCNLSEINGGHVKTAEDFYKACEAASIIGTLQAGYTDFNILSKWSKKIAERDALIGVGITGMCEHPDILFSPEVQKKGAEIVKNTNVRMAKILGISPAARTTVIKPSGNSSQMLGTLSGITPGHSRHYIRHIQASNNEQAVQVLKDTNPFMVEPSVWNPENESVVSFPVTLPKETLFKDSLTAVQFLEKVLLTKQNWIEYGTNFDHPSTIAKPKIRMNVSNTCSVRDNEWDEVKKFLWEHKTEFGGVSLLSSSGDLDYPQAPFTSVLTEAELSDLYGAGAILSSGLIVDAHKVFTDVWEACNAALGYAPDLLDIKNDEIGRFVSDNIKDGRFLVDLDGVCFSDVNCIIDYLTRRKTKRLDWVRRFNSFADKYMNSDVTKTAYCLKHVNAYHKWQAICRYKYVDYTNVEWEQPLKEAGSEIATACSGGMCSL